MDFKAILAHLNQTKTLFAQKEYILAKFKAKMYSLSVKIYNIGRICSAAKTARHANAATVTRLLL